MRGLAVRLRQETLTSGARLEARRAYLGTLARTTRLLGRVEELLDGATAGGVRLLPYKGALFAERLYGDLGLRALGDVDLLVHPADRGPAERLLETRGFSLVYPPGRRRSSPRHAHDVQYVAVDDPDCFVELHLKLFHELGGDPSLERLFARACTEPLLGRLRAVPSWDDHLFAVLVHAAAHAFGDHPAWLLDVLLLVEVGASPLRAFEEASRRGLGLPAWVAWLQVRRAVAGELPALPYVPAYARRAALIERLLGPAPWLQAATRLQGILARTLLTESPRDAAVALVAKSLLNVAEGFDALRAGAAQRRAPAPPPLRD
jgi:hypothetical protein